MSRRGRIVLSRFTVPKKERLRLYVGVLKYWGQNEPRRASEVPTSPVFVYLGREFVDGREPSSSTIRGHLYRVACVDHCVKVSMAIRASAFSSRELAIQDLPRHKIGMRVGECGAILFPLPQHVHELVHGVKVQGLVEETLFDPVLPLLVVRRSKELTWQSTVV